MCLSVELSLRYIFRRCDAGESGGEESNGSASRAEDKGEDVDDIVGRMRAGFRQTDDAAKVSATLFLIRDQDCTGRLLVHATYNC